MEPLIRNISDTARWVATYRAQETERPDAVFRDPFARVLAGARGEQIAAATPFMQQAAWSIIARTYLIDQIVEREVGRGGDLVVNLAAGLDPRPYRVDLPPARRLGRAVRPGRTPRGAWGAVASRSGLPSLVNSPMQKAWGSPHFCESTTGLPKPDLPFPGDSSTRDLASRPTRSALPSLLKSPAPVPQR